jgi:uncharacterized RDD family membrane protein YckC
MQTVSLWDDSRTSLATPEQVDLQLEIANIGSRGLAVMIDFAIRYGVLFAFYFVLALTTHLEFAGKIDWSTKTFAILFFLVVFVSEWFYFTVFEWWWNGQTPGKRLLGLRVIRSDGTPVTWIEIVLRNFVRPIDTTGPMALIGMAFIFFHPRAQRPGDLLARTLVIRETPIDWKQFFPEQEAGSLNSIHLPVALSSAEWEALHRYLRRAHSLDLETRQRLARQIRSALLPRTQGTDLESSPLPDEEWLVEISHRI